MIVAAAIKENGLIHFLPMPARHHDVIRAMVKNGYPKPIKGEQGFVTIAGRFVNRNLALKIAILAGQLTMENKKGNQNDLFSEDLW